MSEHTNHEPEQPSERQERQTDWVPPQIWVGSLADYNNGKLHGRWLDAAVPTVSLVAAVEELLSESDEPDAEEYGIFDYEGFGNFRVHQHDLLDHVARVARGIDQYGDAFAAWANLHDGDPTMLDQFEDHYIGEWEQPSYWAHEELVEGWLREALDTVVPESLRRYVIVDCQKFARDAEISGDIHVEKNPEGGVWIFRGY